MAQDRPSVKKINALKARQQLGTLLEEVFYRDAQYIVERAGKPMAAVIPIWQLEELQNHHAPSPKSSKRKSKRTR